MKLVLANAGSNIGRAEIEGTPEEIISLIKRMKWEWCIVAKTNRKIGLVEK